MDKLKTKNQKIIKIDYLFNFSTSILYYNIPGSPSKIKIKN